MLWDFVVWPKSQIIIWKSEIWQSRGDLNYQNNQNVITSSISFLRTNRHSIQTKDKYCNSVIFNKAVANGRSCVFHVHAANSQTCTLLTMSLKQSTAKSVEVHKLWSSKYLSNTFATVQTSARMRQAQPQWFQQCDSWLLFSIHCTPSIVCFRIKYKVSESPHNWKIANVLSSATSRISGAVHHR